MYDIFELDINGKEMAIAVLVCLVFLVGAFGCGYLLGCERTEDLYRNGSGTEPISTELGNAGTNIQNATAGIEAAAGHADQVASGIESAKETAQYIEGAAATSAKLIGQCQSIISTIRQRGEAQTKHN